MDNSEKSALPIKRAPQQQRALDRIDAILAATEVVVAEGGYEDLTMVKIAARAGITHSSIYHYFSSVEAILAELISRLMAEFDRSTADILARAQTPEALIEAALQTIELGFQTYRSTPVIRGLWAATRYLPTLRKIDDEDTARNARLFSDRFMALAPDTDENAIYVSMRMAATLCVPAYEAALSLPVSLHNQAINDFLAMVHSRLYAVVVMPSSKQGE
ncbi:TetR/AcrR family transcriptional regulator [Pseudomonas arsenicoxydans]|uniref:TetR/AcrR family transcriptional regulator n=1 Tax=Pseudomonas arsenicoxydans TaxID=702115 RepID=A0A502HSM2_9PSED|nr:TetR/AcrR family transcriptional regulator [Pseudomonas arsenicoxydans]TPG76406.1 TetR/AcrR family transcriptional regulator [Pseudomonas arsenicoxydans]